jgi:DTW domain-containing protein YfiP
MVHPSQVHRCIRCRLRWDLCLCARAPNLAVTTRVVVLMHAKEWRRSSNTGHLARLALRDAHVAQQGHPDQRLDAGGLVPEGHQGLVLYPGHGARPLTAGLGRDGADRRPLALIVPDGSWGQASQMIKRIPGLASLPTVLLPRPPESVERMRRNNSPDRMSTFEAIAQAVGVLEGEAVERALMLFYRQWMDRMLYLRGTRPYPRA